MKPRYLLLVIRFIGLGLLLASLPTRAQSESSQTPAFLPGSYFKVEDVVPKIDVILIGTIEDLGASSLTAGSVQHRSTKVDVVKVLRGSTAPKITVHLWLRSQGNTFNESEPTLDKPYIFFIDTRKDNELQVWKLLEATGDNVTKVKQLIAQSPK